MPHPPIPKNLADDLSFALQPAEVLGLRDSLTDEGVMEVLIRWENGLPIDATWEVVAVIKDQIPNFHLQDKVAVWGAGNDRPPITRAYARRRNKGKGVVLG